jgi:cell fate regulator YaaT (PSP1 superfamily)
MLRIYGPDETAETDSAVCEVEMNGCRRSFYSNRTGSPLAIGQPVILDADGGYDFGVVYSTGQIALKKLRLKGMDAANQERPSILRCAEEKDIRDFTEIKNREQEIREICQKKIEKHQLDMKLVDIDLRLDQQKLSVFYTATHRVDFRGLVRDLAGEFKARIQMVQITTREEARRANALGPCGCVLCCSSWLQKIHANPFAEKPQQQEGLYGDNHSFNIIGLCNRPKCCLNYSKSSQRNEVSRASGYPPAGSKVTTAEGSAVVESVDTQKKIVWLRYVNGGQKKRLSLEHFNSMFVKK